MESRLHLTENGPKPCKASLRECPIGGAHFNSKAEADLAFEFKATKKFNPFSRLKKRDPFTSHIAKAEKRIEALEGEMKLRDARQVDGTIYHQFLAEGVTEGELEARVYEGLTERQAGISYVKSNPGEAKIMGLSYQGDYKAEEEYGMSFIAKNLREKTYAKDDVLVYTSGEFTVFAIRGERNFSWNGDPNTDELLIREADKAKKRYEEVPYKLSSLKRKLEQKTFAELRAELKGIVVPLPKTKEEAVKEAMKLYNTEVFRTPAVGEFQTGRALVIMTKDPVEAKMMKKLKESHDNGSLALGSSASPFSQGVTFYDDRDLSRETKAKAIRTDEALKHSHAYIAETKSKLKANGSVFAVSPKVDESLKDVRESQYWLNFSPKNGEQIFGLYNKEQLEKIAAGEHPTENA